MNQTEELEKKVLAGTFLQRLTRYIEDYFHNHTQTEVAKPLIGYRRPDIERMIRTVKRRRAESARTRSYHNHIHNSSEVVPEQSYSESD